MIGLCLECPEIGLGVTPKNVGNAIAIYGSIWLLWLVINRIISEELVFMDTICNFCQVRRALRLLEFQAVPDLRACVARSAPRDAGKRW